MSKKNKREKGKKRKESPKTERNSPWQSHVRKPLLKATSGHSRRAHLQSQVWQGQTWQAPLCKTLAKPGVQHASGRSRTFQATHANTILDKSGQNPRKSEILVSPSCGRRTTHSEITYKTCVLSAFWPPKKTSEVNICKKWPPFCRVFCRNGLQTAERRVSKLQNTTKIRAWEPPHGPPGEKRPFLNSKKALKPENGAFFAKSRPRNAGFEQKCSKMASFLQDFCLEGLHSAERRGSTPPNTTIKGVWSRQKSVKS